MNSLSRATACAKSPLALLLVVFGAFGCSKNDDVLDFVKFNDEFADTIAAKGKDGPEAAQKAFDEKKDELKKKYDGIKDARGFQVSEENLKKLETSVGESVTKVCMLQVALDKAKGEKFKKICDDYTGLLQAI